MDWKLGGLIVASRGLTFKTFITPQFGVIVFWTVAIPTLISAGIALARSQIAIGLGMFALVFGFRIFFEAMTVLFQIHGVLVDIRDQHANAQAATERETKLNRARELASRQKITAVGEHRLDGT